MATEVMLLTTETESVLIEVLKSAPALAVCVWVVMHFLSFTEKMQERSEKRDDDREARADKRDDDHKQALKELVGQYRELATTTQSALSQLSSDYKQLNVSTRDSLRELRDALKGGGQ